jgi:DNA-binding transcriptional regulator YdaS (Cro superfamily)
VTITEQRHLVARAEALAGGAQTLAARLGVRSSTVYRWLNGTRRMHGMAVRSVEGFITETEARNG